MFRRAPIFLAELVLVSVVVVVGTWVLFTRNITTTSDQAARVYMLALLTSALSMCLALCYEVWREGRRIRLSERAIQPPRRSSALHAVLTVLGASVGVCIVHATMREMPTWIRAVCDVFVVSFALAPWFIYLIDVLSWREAMRQHGSAPHST